MNATAGFADAFSRAPSLYFLNAWNNNHRSHLNTAPTVGKAKSEVAPTFLLEFTSSRPHRALLTPQNLPVNLYSTFRNLHFIWRRKLHFDISFVGFFWVVFKENLTPEQNVQRCTWWTSVFVFFCLSLCWLKSQFFNWMWWSSMLPFSSLPSCVTVWVGERCLWIYFTHFNFVVLVRRKTQFLDKRALKKKNVQIDLSLVM